MEEIRHEVRQAIWISADSDMQSNGKDRIL